jgi:hypothetical protein
VPRSAVGRCGGEQVLKRLSGKETALCLAQIGIRGITSDPQVSKLANRTGGLKTLQTQRSSHAGSCLSAIDHDIDSTGLPAISTA